jgi:O-antigen/teichoic acid export membrane protein
MSTPRAMLRSWLGVVRFQALSFVVLAATAALAVVAVPPAIWGEYWMLLSVVQIVNGIGLSWVAQSILLFARKELRAGGDGRQLLESALLLQSGLLAAICIAGLILRPLGSAFLNPTLAVLALIALCIALTALQESISYALQADGRLTGLGPASFLAKLGPLLAVAAIWLGAPAHAELLLAGLAAGCALAALVSFAALPPANGPREGSTVASIRSLVAYGGLLPVASAAGVLSAWMHVWFVRAYGGAIEAGIYGWAASIYALVGMALVPLSAVIAPHLTDLVIDRDQERLRHRSGLFHAVAAIACVAAPFALACVHVLAAHVLPERYSAAGPILVLLLAAVPAQLITYLVSPLLLASPDAIRRIVAANVLMAGLNILLNLLLTPRFGGQGAALALAVSVWCGALLLERQARGIAGEAGGWRPTFELAGLAVLTVIGALAATRLGLSAIALGIGATVAMLIAMRMAGVLRPLAAFAGHIAFLPGPLRRPLTGFFRWCDTAPRSGQI